MRFVKDENSGLFEAKDVPKGINLVYVSSVVSYLNCLDPLFNKAQNTLEIQFILSLLRIRGIQDAGWDAYKNSIQTVDDICKMASRFSGDSTLNLYLWIYGHIVESSEPYEIIANLLNVCIGNPYKVSNFQKKKAGQGRYRNQYPAEKIAEIEELAEVAGMYDVVKPIKDILDRDLRNAVFHSDYAVHNGEIRLLDSDRIYSREKALEIVNKALAYHEVVRRLVKTYIASYVEPRIIDGDGLINSDPEMKITVIVRRDHGVIGIRDSWTPEQIQAGKIPIYLGTSYPYEKKFLNNRDAFLPKSRIVFWNRYLGRLPKPLARLLKVYVEKHLIEIY